MGGDAIEPGSERATILARVAEISTWRHRIDVGRGIVTPGTEDTDAEWRRLGLPDHFTRRRVLDIGCSDGYYSFRAERGGAEVVAIDDESSYLADDRRNGFRIAAELTGSNATYLPADVHDLSPDGIGQFDDLLFLNVLYHLKNPMLALERMASVTRPGGRLFLKTYYRTDVRLWIRGRCIGVDLDRRPKWWFFPDRELSGDPTNWWAPNRAGLTALLEATGWEQIRHTGTWRDRIYVHASRASD